MFHFEGGLMLTRARLAVDFRRRQPRAFISHAHSDHMARHEYALCTPATAALYHLRLGPRPTRELPYRTPLEWGGLRLTTYPAGHCLGSAALLAEEDEHSLLYTGDFKLEPSSTAEEAELPSAEILVIESTYGHPSYRLPPRAEVIEELADRIEAALTAEAIPVVFAYALGKAQEVTRILTDRGFPVVQHPRVFEVSRVYEHFGVALGRYRRYDGKVSLGEVVVTPPGTDLDLADRPLIRFAATGWAVGAGAKYRLGVDHAVPLSDHADYDDLLEAVACVEPRVVYCTHGPETFVERLRDAGFDAHPLGRPSQLRLF